MASVKDLLGGKGKSFPFAAPGDTIEGIITHIDSVQQTEMDGPNKGKGVFWDEDRTKPKMAVVMTVQTAGPTVTSVTYVDEQTKQSKTETSDDGKWGVFFSGNKFTALQRATSAVDGDVNEGDYIKVTFNAYSDRAPQTRGHSAAKLYSVEHKPGVKGVNVATGKAQTTAPSGAAPTTAAPVNGAPYGARPDSIPDAVWATMPDATKAQISPPPIAVAETSAYGARPVSIPEVVWNTMDAAVRAQISPAVVAGPARPEYIPVEVWDWMDDATKAATAGAAAAVASPV